MKIIVLTALLPAVLLAGCATTTDSSRKGAAATKQIVAQFRTLQQKQLDDMNNAYNQEFSKLIGEMTQLTWKETDQGFDRESVLLADKLAEKWDTATEPGAVAQAMLQTVQGDYASLRTAETALDNLRKDYHDQYQTATGQFNLLKQIEANLDALAKTPAEWNDAQTTLKMFYQAYQDTKADMPTNTPAGAKK